MSLQIRKYLKISISILILATIIILILGLALFDIVFSIPDHSRLIKSTPTEALGHGAVEMRCFSDDGTEIPGWFWQGTNSKAVILLHGLGGTRSQLSDFAKFLHENGFSVLLIDMRGHGQNSAKYTSFGRAESLDVLASIEWLRTAKNFSSDEISIYGASMGAATALNTLSVYPKPSRIIADSSYASLAQQSKWDLTYEKAPVKIPASMHAIILGLFNLTAPFFIGNWADGPDPIDSIQKAHCPILLIHGEFDTRIPPECMQNLYDSAKKSGVEIEKWLVPNGGHCNYRSDPEYRQKILEFLKR